jgi:hypothetical protein
MPPRVDPTEKKNEQAALKRVVTHSFTANPPSVKTFGTTVISWNVTVPDSPVDITVKLNGQLVAPVGSKKFPLSQTTSFTLSAVTEHTGKQLGKLTVRVDAADCKTNQLADAFLISKLIETQVRAQLSGSSDVKLRGDGLGVTLGDQTISIGVPLEIEVPSWFNADMTIDIQLSRPFGPKDTLSLKSLSVDVHWTFFEHLFSLGCTGLVQAGMEQLAQVFLTHIVKTEILPVMEKTFDDKAAEALRSLQAADPQRREYAITLVTLSPDGLTITACPKA